MPNLPSFFSLTKSLSNDAPTRITELNIIFYELDVRCLTNPVLIGNGNELTDYLNVGEIITLKNVNAKDIIIKNHTAGNNGAVVISGTLPNAVVSQTLRL